MNLTQVRISPSFLYKYIVYASREMTLCLNSKLVLSGSMTVDQLKPVLYMELCGVSTFLVRWSRFLYEEFPRSWKLRKVMPLKFLNFSDSSEGNLHIYFVMTLVSQVFFVFSIATT